MSIGVTTQFYRLVENHHCRSKATIYEAFCKYKNSTRCRQSIEMAELMAFKNRAGVWHSHCNNGKASVV
jgi:hypothetical protein